jgi:CHASE3 domain sensor protein
MKQLVVIGLVVPLLCTLTLGWLQWDSVQDMLRTREMVRHIRAVQLALATFRYSLSDAESCQFRYILTHDDANLQLYRKLIAQAEEQLSTVRTLTKAQSDQQASLAELGPLLSDKEEDADHSFSNEQLNNHDAAMKLISSPESRDNMLHIESIVEQMQAVESRVLQDGQNRYTRNFTWASSLSLLSMALCLLCVGGIVLLLRRLSEMQSLVTLSAVSQMIEYEGGMITIEEYVKRRQMALATHGAAQIEAERLLGKLEHRKLRTAE